MDKPKLKRSYRLTPKEIKIIERRNKYKKIQKKLIKLLFKKDKS
tara:strand:+ start:791 stop:922 length:132 start_codon:yes stop_codon:yes gene_type:complete